MVDCSNILANAAVHGDEYDWCALAPFAVLGPAPCRHAPRQPRATCRSAACCAHRHVDADPMTFPSSPWTTAHGQYVNREPGKPYFVSLL